VVRGAEPGAKAGHEGEPGSARWHEVLAVAALVAVADLTIYRGEGFAGMALRAQTVSQFRAYVAQWY
jgi:hypothetical protein